MIFWLAPIIVFTLALGAFTFLSVKGITWRIIAASIYICLVAISFFGTFEAASLPKPIALEWRPLAGSQIISFQMVENEAIYIWVVRKTDHVLAAYVLPWDVQQAQALQDGGQQVGEKGGGKLVLTPRIDGVPEAPFFSKVVPPQALPPKQPD